MKVTVETIMDASSRQLEPSTTAKYLNGRSITIISKVDDGLYGSVGPREIVEAIFAEHKIRISESCVAIEEPFKTMGPGYVDVVLRLTKDVVTTIKVWIVTEKQESPYQHLSAKLKKQQYDKIISSLTQKYQLEYKQGWLYLREYNRYGAFTLCGGEGPIGITEVIIKKIVADVLDEVLK